MRWSLLGHSSLKWSFMTCGSLIKRLYVTKVPSFRIGIGTILVILTKGVFYGDEIARDAENNRSASASPQCAG